MICRSVIVTTGQTKSKYDSLQSNDDSSKPPLGLIIGCTVAAVVVVAAIIIGVVLFLRFRKNVKSPESSGGEGVEE